MALIDFSSELQAASSLPDLARRLGAHCLDRAERLREMKGQEASAAALAAVAARTRPISAADWEKAIARPTALADRGGADLLAALAQAQLRQPLDFLGVLLGLCTGALDEYFRTFTGELALDRGMPIPDATRPVPDGVEWMTWPGTQNEGGLLAPLAWTLFGFARAEGPGVVLDFSHRERIDELTWTGHRRLPLIATVHPPIGDLGHRLTRPGRFFDVRPLHPDPQWLFDRLASVGDAQIAVLPELCLARPDELQAGLAADRDSYPPLVVAGSAHVRIGSGSDEVRANESRIYLDGEHVATSRKQLPFKTKALGGVTYEEPLREDLSDEPRPLTVLSSTHTRLAVVICADLIDARIPSRLVAAGVNLLLAPAMTPKAGSFETTVEEISGRRQGVSAIANLRLSEAGKPFLCMLGTPRADREARLATLTGAAAPAPPDIAFFDSHAALPGAVEWR